MCRRIGNSSLKHQIVVVGSAVLVLFTAMLSLSFHNIGQEERFQNTMVDQYLPVVETARQIQFLIQNEQQYIGNFFYERDYMYLQEAQQNTAAITAAMNQVRGQIQSIGRRELMTDLQAMESDFAILKRPIRQIMQIDAYNVNNTNPLYGEAQGMLTTFTVDSGILSNQALAVFETQKHLFSLKVHVLQTILVIASIVFSVAILLFSYLIFRLLGRLELKGQIDELTGLYNKRFLRETLNAFVERQQTFGIIMIDLDHFKTVNDEHGHAVGDAVLRHLAVVLKNSIRGGDFPCRFGGEEFILILPVTSLSVLATAAERIRKAVEHTAFPTVLRKTCSVGYGIWEKGEAVDELITRVDDALYRAKNNGRNRVEASAHSKQND